MTINLKKIYIVFYSMQCSERDFIHSTFDIM